MFREAFLLVKQSFSNPEVSYQVAILMMGIVQTLVDSESAEFMNEEVLEMLKQGNPFKDCFLEYLEETAKREGLQEGRKETAMRALQKGLDNETIAEISDLTLEEVKELAKTA